MSTLIHHPKRLLPEELDHYLSMGWRPTGQSIYNSNFLRLENGEVVSVLPTRMELTNYTFTKSLRKLLRRNLARFRVAYGPATMPSPDFLAVNQRYMLYCPDKSLENLEYHVLGNKLRRVFNTWETRVYDGDRLVAFSYFDLGSDSAYSKAGIYDPIYSKHSLGLFTLLLEVELCLRMQKAFFYPG
ncbi:MAG: arginine-tRNA-protein transferase, partial [Bacteroidota bacterium]